MTSTTNTATTLHPMTQRVLVFLSDFCEKNGYSPTYGEILSGCSLSSKSHVSYHLDILQSLGMIKRRPFLPRSIVVTSEQLPARA